MVWKRYFAIFAVLVFVFLLIQSFAGWFERHAVLLGALAAFAVLIGIAIRVVTQIGKEPKSQPAFVPARPELSRAEKFVMEYRKRLAEDFANYDFLDVGIGSNIPASAPTRRIRFDDVFLNLRLGNSYDPSRLDLGTILQPEQLAARERHLTVKGSAGAGKTTWLQWMFRQLLRTNTALPIFVELRRLAYDWSKQGLGERMSFDDYLERWAASKGCPEIKEWLKEGKKPRPILLVDGWDELGDLGREVRYKLYGFLRAHPHALAVVTSRPYGEGRPDEARFEGEVDFEVQDLQPLNDEEVKTYALRYNEFCFVDEKRERLQRTESFLNGLKASRGAETLARTPLLLTMLLAIGRTRDLPEKRHQLYQRIVEGMLERPKRKEHEGARFGDWRPQHNAEGLQVVATLAYKLQASTDSQWSVPIVADWEQLKNYLPVGWSDSQKGGFLSWLSGPAALLDVRSDDKLGFPHLSFQEFFAGWYVFSAGHVADIIRKHQDDEYWWETIRLCGGLAEDSGSSLDAILEELSKTRKGSPLAGSLLADGLGSTAAFELWKDRFYELLRSACINHLGTCGRFWQASGQQERVKGLRQKLTDETAGATFASWVRLEAWSGFLSVRDPEGPTRGMHAWLVKGLRRRPETEADFAIQRLLTGGDPLWPRDPWELALFNAWPAHRRLVGARIQSWVAFRDGSVQQDLGEVLSDSCRRIETAKEPVRDLLRSWEDCFVVEVARGADMGEPSSSAQDVHRRATRNHPLWAIDAACCRVGDSLLNQQQQMIAVLPNYVGDPFTNETSRFLVWWWAAQFAYRGCGAFMRLPAGGNAWLKRLLIKECRSENLVSEFVDFEMASIGRFLGRQWLSEIGQQLSPTQNLLAAASRLSLRPQSVPTEFEECLKAYGQSGETEPLWPALARHLARRSTPNDRALLDDLARHPEKRDPPLSWGLKYIVRGDVVLETGRVVSLDELCADNGLPCLPYVQDLPPELDINWGESK